MASAVDSGAVQEVRRADRVPVGWEHQAPVEG